ncbi:MAG: putative glycoside hydrolase, partial [Candidatus Limnocylindria bacterium]
LAIRPWIQDFGYGPFRAYTAADIFAERQALSDNAARGFMTWNAAARFTAEALGPPVDDEAAGSTQALPTSPAHSASGSPAPSASP